MAFQATTTTASAYLKELYPGTVEDELNEEIGVYAIMEKEKVSIPGQGQHIVRPFRVARNQGVGARSENGYLPMAGTQGVTSAKINMASNYLHGSITNYLIRTTFSDQAAFENALDFEMRYSAVDFTKEYARQLYTVNGQLSTVNGTVTASTSVVVNDLKYFVVGMYLEFWNGATNQTTNDPNLPGNGTGSAIVSINTTTNTLTMTTAQTITTGATIARAGNNTAATTSYEIQSLGSIIDASGSTYFGVNRGTYPILNGNVTDAAHVMGETTMQIAIDNARQVGGGLIDFIGCDYGTRRAYTNLLTSNKRYPLEGVTAPKFAGGLELSKDLRTQLGEGLSFSGAPVCPSAVNPTATMYFLDTESWKHYNQSEIEWIMNGDSVLHPQLTAQNKDGYEFALYMDSQLFSNAPNRNSKVINTF